MSKTITIDNIRISEFIISQDANDNLRVVVKYHLLEAVTGDSVAEKVLARAGSSAGVPPNETLPSAMEAEFINLISSIRAKLLTLEGII